MRQPPVYVYQAGTPPPTVIVHAGPDRWTVDNVTYTTLELLGKYSSDAAVLGAIAAYAAERG